MGTSPAKKRRTLPDKLRKEMILDAALDIFSQHGYENSDVDAIAAHAGIGKGTIYRHFPSKMELFLAVVDRSYEKLREKMGNLACVDAPFREKMEVGLKLYVDFFVDNPKYYNVLMLEQPDHRLRLDEKVIMGHQRFATHLIKAIKAGIAAGELKPVDPVFAAHSLMAIASVIIEKRLYGKKYARGKDISNAIDLFLRGTEQ